MACLQGLTLILCVSSSSFGLSCKKTKKKPNNFVIKGGSTFMETYCPWLYLLTSSLWFTVWLQFNQFLWQVHFVMPEIFSVITIKMCWLKRILIPDESESRAVLRKSDSRWVKISSLHSVPMANLLARSPFSVSCSGRHPICLIFYSVKQQRSEGWLWNFKPQNSQSLCHRSWMTEASTQALNVFAWYLLLERWKHRLVFGWHSAESVI